VQSGLVGFAAGIMVAASVWSLLLPALERANGWGTFSFIPATVGFFVGMLFLLVLDCVIPRLYAVCRKNGRRRSMLALAVTLHNLPEGMAVGAVFAGLLASGAEIGLMAAFSLSIGIALQNFPEGAIVSLPLKTDGKSGLRAFAFGSLSGIVEPIASLITIAFTALITPVLSYLLAFAAGAMIYVVVEELIPESQDGEHSNIATVGVMLGFAIMMVLDMALG
jgi:ZIP family zinc transporter